MSGDDQNFTIWGFVKGFGKLVIGFLLLLQGLIGLVFLLLFIGVAVSISNGMAGGQAAGGAVQAGSALLLNPNGILVEQGEEKDPFEAFFEQAYGLEEPAPVEVHDVVRAIRKAKEDDRIKALVLDLGQLYVPASSASKVYDIAKELDAFKAADKRIIAVGDYYGQEQYYLAARADEIHLNHYGNVVLYGYGSYTAYVKTLLEKLKVTTHIFRVGTFKSAVEPFLRDDMSPEAKEANLAYLNVLWDEYARGVEESRELAPGAVKRYADNLGALLEEADGDFAKTALDYGLIDSLKSRNEQLAYLVETFGADKSGKSFKHVTYSNYLTAIGEKTDGDAPNVAVVTAAGVIVDGEAPPGQAAAGDTVAKYLKMAHDDDKVKAVVLRVDSPGGSVFASEVIRDGVLALKKKGKPVVVSMGSLAASGGYWISSPADEIWAAPTTITGSIGIFGLFTTFENTAAEIGVYVDGVGTSTLSPILATGIGPLPEEAADIFQRSTENGYRRFLEVVGEGRDLDPDYIDSIGQGRVWIGRRAHELKLVDKLGGLDDAVASAAARAGLENYDVVEMVVRSTPFERLFGKTSAQILSLAGLDRNQARSAHGALKKLIAGVADQIEFFEGFNDPNGLYARCLACESK